MQIEEALEPAANRINDWTEGLVAMAPNIVVAVVILVAAWLLARLGRGVAMRLATRASARRPVARLLGTLTAFAILVAGLFIALGVLRLDKTVTSLLAGAGVAGIALGLAAQSLAASLLSGTVISIRKPYKEGDFIETAGHSGVVDRIDLRVTRLQTPDGQTILLPNKDILEQPLTNHSQLGARRVDVAVGVSYAEDLERAARIAAEAVDGVPKRLRDRDIEVFYEEFGGSSINFTLRFWVPFERPADLLAARSSAIQRIKAAFDEHGVTIPFPIRTLDFGITGGLALGEALGTRQGARG